MRKWVSLCPLILMAVGCATTDDPRHGGLFSYNRAAYEQRLEQRRQNLQALQQNQQQDKERSQELEKEIQVKQVLLDRERERIRFLDDELARLQKKVSQYQAQSNAQRVEKQRLGQEVKRLQGQIITLKNERLPAQAENEKKIESIQREIDELSKLATQLTR